MAEIVANLHCHPYASLHEEIAKLAYHLWQCYGGQPTSKEEEIDNWLESQALVMARLGGCIKERS